MTNTVGNSARKRRMYGKAMKADRKPQTQYFGNKRGEPSKAPNRMPEDVSEYAAAKARRLTIEQFERAGLNNHAKEYANSTFVTNPLIAFARYIDAAE